MREVLREIGADDVAELVVINKSDVADPIAVQAVMQRERNCVVVSAQTGAGIGELLAALEGALPRHDTRGMHGLPYERGDLLARAHEEGEVLELRARRRRHPRPGPGADVARGRVRAGGPGRPRPGTVPILRRVTAAGNKPIPNGQWLELLPGFTGL